MAKTKLSHVVAKKKDKLTSIKELQASQVLIPVASWSKEKDASGKPNSGIICKFEDGTPAGTLDVNDMLATLGEQGMKNLGVELTPNADGSYQVEMPEKITGLTISKGDILTTVKAKTEEELKREELERQLAALNK